MLTPQSLNDVRDASVLQVVERYVKLKRNGGNMVAPCPFHNEKSASFTVNAAKNMFKCFGCGVGGDAVSFVRQYDKLDFVGAAERVAEICNFSLEYDKDFDKEAYQLKKEERKGMQLLMDECAARFTAQLGHEGCPGMAYLRDVRGYDAATMEYWGLGYAGDDNAIARHYFSTGNLPQLVALSLVTEKDSHHADFFRNRVLFPIHNERGEVVSFGGRVIGDGSPKYLNTANTDLYDKSKVLYGMYQAIKGIKLLKYATITEGYTDVIGLHRGGLINAVATCGTALTDGHCQLLKRHTDRVLLMRDGDAAGLKATSKDLGVLLRHGFAVDVLPLEDGKDPDDFAKAFHVTSFPGVVVSAPMMAE